METNKCLSFLGILLHSFVWSEKYLTLKNKIAHLLDGQKLSVLSTDEQF